MEYKEKKKEGEKEPESERVRPYEPPIPYPQRLKKQEYDKQFAKFLERFKTLHINVPIVECQIGRAHV